MVTDIMSVVIVTKLLIEEGWEFVDNSMHHIEYVENTRYGEKIVFECPGEFGDWLVDRMEDFA